MVGVGNDRDVIMATKRRSPSHRIKKKTIVHYGRVSSSKSKLSVPLNGSNSPINKSDRKPNDLHGYAKILEQVNWYFQIKDTITCEEFYRFNSEQGLTCFFSFGVIFVIFGMVPVMIVSIINIMNPNKLSTNDDDSISVETWSKFYYKSLIFTIVSLILTILLAALGIYIHVNHHSSSILGFCSTQLFQTLSRWFCLQELCDRVNLWFKRYNPNAVPFSWLSYSCCHSNQNKRNQKHRVMDESLLSKQHNNTDRLPNISVRQSVANSHGFLNQRSSKVTPLDKAPHIKVNALRNIYAWLSTFDAMRWAKQFFVLIAQLLYYLAFIRNAILRDCSVNDTQHHFDTRTFQLNGKILPKAFSSCDYPDFYVFFHAWLLIFLPFFLFISLPDVSIVCVWIASCLNLIVIGFVASYMQARHCWIVLIFYCLAVGCLVIDTQVRKIQMFLLTKDLKDTLAENQRMADETHAQEMRHMIANVAHDLKTPLASFITGMDLIQLAIDDCKSAIKSSPAISHLGGTVIAMVQNYDSIQSCIENIKNTHSFMLMTINRCIDYTKASKGLKLVPRYDTIGIKDAIELPITCMRNMQQRIGIIPHPIPEDLCSYVITDKQWLQENLLCLLSNAVKYSAEGNVTISISMDEYYTYETFGAASSGDGVSADDGSIRNEESVHSDISNCMLGKRSSSDLSQKLTLPQLMPFIRVEVEDTGIGMSEEAMASLFNPFKQTQRLAGGTGLGLYSLAKRLEALHGFYGVMKRRDGQSGSLFWFAIPYKPDLVYAHHMRNKTRYHKGSEDRHLDNSEVNGHSEVPSIDVTSTKIVTLPVPSVELRCDTSTLFETSAMSMPASFASICSNTPTDTSISSDVLATTVVPKDNEKLPVLQESSVLSILLVDDSPTIVKMSTLMLKRMGHKVTSAENGAIAVKLVQERLTSTQRFFDVIFMDLQMPVMDGLEATRRIRGIEEEYGTTAWRLNVSSADSDGVDDIGVDIENGLIMSSSHHTKEKDASRSLSKCKQLIIGMSANSDNETAEYAFEAGVDAFLPKPFTIDSVRGIMNDVFSAYP